MQNSDLEVLRTAISWLKEGSSVELVTLVSCQGSSPRPVGSLAAVRSDGAIVGSVSGGCIEKELSTLLRQEKNCGVIQYNISNKEAIRFGLVCGSSLELVFERLEDCADLEVVLEQLNSRKRISRTLNIETGESSIESVGANQGFQFDGKKLIKIFGSNCRLLLIGAGQLSRFVAEIALGCNYEIIVCEPREHFSSTWSLAKVPVDKRMPDEVVKMFASDNRTAVLALSHETNLDDLAILEALDSEAFYIGALGSKRSCETRQKRLEFLGASEEQIARVHAPIGLAIGSYAPAEIAISILAELIAVRSSMKLVSGSSQNRT